MIRFDEVRRVVALLLLAASLAGAPLVANAGAEEDRPTPVWANLGVEFDCLVEPQERVIVSANIEGVVEKVLVERGDVVEKGQVIARLEADLERATVAFARARAEATADIQGSEARAEFEKRRLARSARLSDEGVISSGEIDEIESALIIAEADVLRAYDEKLLAELELRRAQVTLEKRTVRSPLDGVVVKKIAKAGEYADPPEVLELAQIDPLLVEVFAPLSLYGSIKEGMLGKVRLEEPLGGEYEAAVIVVDRVVDAASGTFGVRLELPNPENALPPGLKCRVAF